MKGKRMSGRGIMGKKFFIETVAYILIAVLYAGGMGYVLNYILDHYNIKIGPAIASLMFATTMGFFTLITSAMGEAKFKLDKAKDEREIDKHHLEMAKIKLDIRKVRLDVVKLENELINTLPPTQLEVLFTAEERETLLLRTPATAAVSAPESPRIQ